MFCFQLSLLLFKSIPFSHHLYACRRAEESHTWQLLSSGRQAASPEGDHLPVHPNNACIQRWLYWGSALLSCLHTKPFLQCLKPRARHWCQGFHPFQFLQHRLLRGPFLWFLPGSFPGGKDSGGFVPFVFAKRLHSCWHQGVTGGSTGRRPWPLHPGYSSMALGIEQPRKDKFTWLSLGDPANTFSTDDCMLISNTAQPKGRGCFDSSTMVVINWISHLSSGWSFRIFPSPQTPVVEDIFRGPVHAAPREGCCRNTHSPFHLTCLLRKKDRHAQQVPLRQLDVLAMGTKRQISAPCPLVPRCSWFVDLWSLPFAAGQQRSKLDIFEVSRIGLMGIQTSELVHCHKYSDLRHSGRSKQGKEKTTTGYTCDQ